MREDIIVVGVDPSLSNWGMVKTKVSLKDLSIEVLDLTLIPTKKESGKSIRVSSDDLRRSKLLSEGFRAYCVDADIIMAEIPTWTQSSRGAMSNGICLGILASSLKPIIQLMPLEVKVGTVGKKTATKKEMIDWAIGQHPDAKWLMRKLKGEIVPVAKNEHLADAVAVVHTGVKLDEFRNVINILRSIL